MPPEYDNFVGAIFDGSNFYACGYLEGTVIKSTDGTSWNQLGLTSPNPIDLEAMSIRFGVTTPEANPNPGQARIDNFNL